MKDEVPGSSPGDGSSKTPIAGVFCKDNIAVGMIVW